MICEEGNGYYLFEYETEEDGPCRSDLFMEKIEEGEDYVFSTYGVRQEYWQLIPDPPRRLSTGFHYAYQKEC